MVTDADCVYLMYFACPYLVIYYQARSKIPGIIVILFTQTNQA